jgi:hypothetical protein
MRGEGGGFLAFFWPKFTKNVTGEGEGRGQNLKKRAKFTFFVNLFLRSLYSKSYQNIITSTVSFFNFNSTYIVECISSCKSNSEKKNLGGGGGKILKFGLNLQKMYGGGG